MVRMRRSRSWYSGSILGKSWASILSLNMVSCSRRDRKKRVNAKLTRSEGWAFAGQVGDVDELQHQVARRQWLHRAAAAGRAELVPFAARERVPAAPAAELLIEHLERQLGALRRGAHA